MLSKKTVSAVKAVSAKSVLAREHDELQWKGSVLSKKNVSAVKAVGLSAKFVLAREHDELQWHSMQQSYAITICHRLRVSINHLH